MIENSAKTCTQKVKRDRPWWVAGLAFAALVLAACAPASNSVLSTPTPFTGQPRPVVIDTDMAADDWMAILYLLRRPDVTIKAITVTGTGLAHCEPGVRHALGLVALAGEKDIPVACGRETPLQGNHAFPAAWRDEVDRLYGLELPGGSNPAAGQQAVELLTDVIEASAGEVAVLTLGPLTNVAEALEGNPGLVGKLGMVYTMGGAVEVPGNVGASDVGIDNPVAEWNFYIDPHAASQVFQSGVPITLVPLDATNQVPITPGFYQRLRAAHDSPAAAFLYDLLTLRQDFIQSGTFYFWDPLAAALLTDESLAAFETRPLRVVEGEGPQSGWTHSDEGGMPMRIALSADGQRFEQVFLSTLNSP